MSCRDSTGLRWLDALPKLCRRSTQEKFCPATVLAFLIALLQRINASVTRSHNHIIVIPAVVHEQLFEPADCRSILYRPRGTSTIFIRYFELFISTVGSVVIVPTTDASRQGRK